MAELSETKIEQLNKQPIIETSVAQSQDGKWVVHKTTITDGVVIFINTIIDHSKTLTNKLKEDNIEKEIPKNIISLVYFILNLSKKRIINFNLMAD